MIEYILKECQTEKPNRFKNVALEKEFFEELQNDLELLSNVLILQVSDIGYGFHGVCRSIAVPYIFNPVCF